MIAEINSIVEEIDINCYSSHYINLTDNLLRSV